MNCGRLMSFVADLRLLEVRLSKVKLRVFWLVVSDLVLRYIRPVVDSECSIWETLETDPCSP